MNRSIFIGFDLLEGAAFHVAQSSLLAYASAPINIDSLALDDLYDRDLYSRPTEIRDGHLFDLISDAPMSTEFAISRFLVPSIAGTDGWALFCDCDMLFRAPVDELFDLADDRFAVQVVQHAPPTVGRHASGMKMGGQIQTAYRCKNWSSVMLFNLAHPANLALTVEHVNSVPGRDLHAFSWLTPDLIGELPPQWNHLIGIDAPDPATKIAHFTLGTPDIAGYENCEFADEWTAYL